MNNLNCTGAGIQLFKLNIKRLARRIDQNRSHPFPATANHGVAHSLLKSSFGTSGCR